MCAKQFESFLVEQFLLHAKGNIRAGYRYQFNSPDHANSQRLFDALLARKGGERALLMEWSPPISCATVGR